MRFSSANRGKKLEERFIMKKTFVAIALAISLAPTFKAQAGNTPEKNIVEIAAKAGQFNTLVAAVKAAGLVETLVGTGPFTVFAPTDDAFAKLPEGTVASLLKPENKDKLVSVLTYHVLPGKVPASAVKTMKAKTVNGQQVSLKVSDQGVSVDKAKVVKTDIMASNGVIHVIDSVILPQ